MPNHVKNVLKFKNLKSDEVDFILDTLCTPLEEGEDMYIPDKTQYGIDFDKIVPEPKFEEDCPDDCKVNKDSHVMEDKERPWFDWYKWHLKYWGTKWNAYDRYSIIGKSYVTLVFNTAWTSPDPIIEQLSLLGFDFELRYADEDLGNNCGKFTYNRKKGFDGGDSHYGLADPYSFAKRLWNTY